MDARYLLSRLAFEPKKDAPPGSRRANRTKSSCIPCRDRKSKCNGGRPTCMECRRRLIECSYNAAPGEGWSAALKREVETLRSVLEMLKTAPEPVAKEALVRIREGIPPARVLEQSIASELLSNGLSMIQAARAVAPPTQSELEFELVALHPKVYPAIIPLDMATVDLSLLGLTFGSSMRPSERGKPKTLLVPGRYIAAAPSTHPGADQAAVRAGSGTLASLDPSKLDRSSGSPGGHASARPSPPSFADERLNRLQISHWTRVPVTNHFAASALSLYLSVDYAFLQYFDADIFLDALAERRDDFCSVFLVNALLSFACHGYTAKDSTAITYSRLFYREAVHQFEEERTKDSLTTLSGVVLLAMSSNNFGRDIDGQRYLEESARMARRMGLVDIAHPAGYELPTPSNMDPTKYRMFSSTVAWAVFTWHMMHSFCYRSPPLVDLPPPVPIIGDPIENNPSGCFGRRPYSKATFAGFVKMWLVVRDMNKTYWSHPHDVSLRSAEFIYQKLLSWADELPLQLGRGDHNPNDVINIHIYFHTVVLDLFRPFTAPSYAGRLGTFTAADSRACAVFAASIEQLKRLVYIYRSFASSECCIMGHSGMLYLVNEIIQGNPSDEAQFYFLLCMRGYKNLAKCVPIVRGIVQSIFSIAIRQGAILPRDALRMFDEISKDSSRLQGKIDFASAYPIDRGMRGETEAATLEALAGDFERTAAQNDRAQVEAEVEAAAESETWKWSLTGMDEMLTENVFSRMDK